MPIEVFFARESLLALETLERLHLLMHVACVHLETRLAIEHFVARVAREAVGARVIEHVRLETAGLDERFAAVWTLVRADTGVDSHVPIQRAFQAELDVAIGTRVGPSGQRTKD